MIKFKTLDELVKFVLSAKLPDWQVKLFKQNADAVQVHSEGQIFYKIDQLFPNEDPGSKDHRILAFESITEASFSMAANNINRIFKNSSYTVEASDKVADLASQHLYEGQNFYQWFLDEWVRVSLKEDPNARIVVYPPEYTGYKSKPCEFISTEYIRHLSDDMIIFVSVKESEVTYELKTLNIETKKFYDQSINGMNFIEAKKNTFTPKIEASIKRYVYHVFIKGEGFYRVEQLKEKAPTGEDYEVEFIPIKQDFIPVDVAGGEKKKNEINKSFLHPFVAFGNLALLQHSQHTAVNFMFSFPKMSEIQTPCDAPKCTEGWILCDDQKDVEKYGDRKPCQVCGGTGYRRNQTPYKTFVKQFDPQAGVGEQEHLNVDEVKYYTPDVGILDYSKNEWRDYLEQAERAVYVQQKVQTGNVQAAKSKEIDREDLYSFLSRIGQCFFGRLRFALQSFENYLVSSPGQVTVNAPYSYAILSEGEAFTALKDILGSNVPIMLKASQVESFINKFVSQSSPIRRFVDVLRLVDPLLYYNTADISSFKMNNVVSSVQFTNHVFSYPVLQEMYFSDKSLFLLETKVIVDRVKAELKKYEIAEPKGVKDAFIKP